MVIWITGLSGAGKTTVCEAIYKELKPKMPTLVLLDGDIVRAIFGGGLGFSEAERVIQIKRIQALANELEKQAFVVLVAALYSHPDLLSWNRANFSSYFEVYLNTSLDTVKRRDSKGLYARADRGEEKDVVGVDIPWHAPQKPDLVLDGDSAPPMDLARRIIFANPTLLKAIEPATAEI